MQKTKMIFTLGPSTDKDEILEKLILAGMNASRHNFSHGSYDEHQKRIDAVKKFREKHNKHIAIILDTKGPEIRTHKFQNGKVEVFAGNKFDMYSKDEILGDNTKCSVTYKDICEDVKESDIILIDDGLISLTVSGVDKEKGIVYCIVNNDGTIGNNKGINLPGIKTSLPSLTEKDIEDLKFGCKMNIDMVAASFIRKAADILAIRKVLDDNEGHHIQIIAKIENQEGIDNIDEIIGFSDGIMVARGDLGVEIPIEKLPGIQKMIIHKCNDAGKPVITATQMLDSMIRNPRPTRAEASDIANAILDGTDAIMLSGETAGGKYPVEAAFTMAHIAQEAEKHIPFEVNFKKKIKTHLKNVPNAICIAACSTATELNAKAIICATITGNTAKRMVKYRPSCPILAITMEPEVARKLSIYWGVTTVLTDSIEDSDKIWEIAEVVAIKTDFIEKGDVVVIAAGIPLNYSGSTNLMKVHLIGDIQVQGKGIGTRSVSGSTLLESDIGDLNEQSDDYIFVCKEADSKYINLLSNIRGIIIEEGSPTSELIVECMKRDISVIYKAKNATNVLKTGVFITIDINRGLVYDGVANIK